MDLDFEPHLQSRRSHFVLVPSSPSFLNNVHRPRRIICHVILPIEIIYENCQYSH